MWKGKRSDVWNVFFNTPYNRFKQQFHLQRWILLEEVQSKKFHASKHLKIKSILNKEIIKFSYIWHLFVFWSLPKFIIKSNSCLSLHILFNYFKISISVRRPYRAPVLTLQANFKSFSKRKNFSSMLSPGYKIKHHPLHEALKPGADSLQYPSIALAHCVSLIPAFIFAMAMHSGGNFVIRLSLYKLSWDSSVGCMEKKSASIVRKLSHLNSTSSTAHELISAKIWSRTFIVCLKCRHYHPVGLLNVNYGKP